MNNVGQSKYKQFQDYLDSGANLLTEKSREELETYISDNIDIKKSEEIVKSHTNVNDGFVPSPKIFLAISLIDELPKKADLRFAPEFKLDGVIFKCYKGISSEITSIKVPYTEKIQNILTLQTSVDSVTEIAKSGKHVDNLIRNTKRFNVLFRLGIKYYKKDILAQVENLIKPPVIFNYMVNCVVNKKYDFTLKKDMSSLFTYKYRKSFCFQLNDSIDKLKKESNSEITEREIYRESFMIVLDNIFPDVPQENKEAIFEISSNMKKHIDYSVIQSMIFPYYPIRKSFPKYLKECKTKSKKKNKSERFINYELCIKNEQLLNIVSNRKVRVDYVAELRINSFKYSDEEYKDMMELAKLNMQKQKVERHSYISNNSFFNLALLINRYRRLLKKSDSTTAMDLINFSSNATSVNEFITSTHKSDSVLLKNLLPEFHEKIKGYAFWSIAKDEVLLDFSKRYDTVIRKFIVSLYPKKTVFGEGRDRKEILFKLEDLDSKEVDNLMAEKSELVELCKNVNAFDFNDDEHTLHEITSGISITNINNIGTANLLNYLFKEQVGDNYFQDVQHILFHENLIIVSRNNEMSSLFPSELYKQFVLNRKLSVTSTSMVEDYGDVQLIRFNSILNDVLQSKTHDIDFFKNQSGDDFINHLSEITNIKFINSIDVKKYVNPIDADNNNNEIKQHVVSLGSIDKSEQASFTHFLQDFSFIFPIKISEIYLKISKPNKRVELPTDERELIFYIEKQKTDRDMDTKYFITREDLTLLTRNNNFYITILMDRAFSVVFNKEILNNEEVYNEFKEIIGASNIELSKRYFGIRGQSLTESRIIRKIFIQNASSFVQNKREQMSLPILKFMDNIFYQNKQLSA